MDQKINAEDLRWLRQLLGPVRKNVPESVQRKLLALQLASQTAGGLVITDKGRSTVRKQA
jgi:hypothetical protein